MRQRGKILYSQAGHKWQRSVCALHAGYLGLQTHPHNMYCSLHFHCNDSWTNEPRCYVMHILPFLLKAVLNFGKYKNFLKYVCVYTYAYIYICIYIVYKPPPLIWTILWRTPWLDENTFFLIQLREQTHNWQDQKLWFLILLRILYTEKCFTFKTLLF
jgi:hypothetical protein